MKKRLGEVTIGEYVKICKKHFDGNKRMCGCWDCPMHHFCEFVPHATDKDTLNEIVCEEIKVPEE